MTEPSAEGIPKPPAEPTPRHRYTRMAAALAAALIVLIAIIAAAPFWAPPLLPLLPWGTATGPDPKLLQRIERLETAREREQQTATHDASALDQLSRRVAGLEAKQGDQQQAAAKAASVSQQLESRIAALETAQQREQQITTGAATNLNQLDSRIAAFEARPEISAKDIADLRQQLEKLSSAGSALTARIEALEKPAHVQSATDPSDAALMLNLLQIREAVQAARPFAAEYDALTGLARNRPEIAEAASPLADTAKTGVASRAVLAKRLHDLAGSIANAQAANAASDWRSETLARLRGLVTIRRIGGAGQSVSEAAVSAAETALASGDLAGAIAALDKLTGAAADAARPWLQMARERQSVETALRRIEALLVMRLGKQSEADTSAGPSR
jgi:hypothetical protein